MRCSTCQIIGVPDSTKLSGGILNKLTTLPALRSMAMKRFARLTGMFEPTLGIRIYAQ
jgi:hypothetical protein